MPTQLQQARYDGLLRRVGDLKGGGSKVNEVLGEVFPVLDLENVPAELALLAGWRLGFGSVIASAVAGNHRLIQLFNPANSGALVVPTRIWLRISANQLIEYDIASAGLADTFSSAKVRDTRLGVTTTLVTQLREATQPGSITGIGNLFTFASEIFPFEDRDGLFVLGPGTGLTFSTTIQNSLMTINFHWRERLAEPSELNF